MVKRDDSKTLRNSAWIALLVVASLVLLAGIFAKYTMVSDPATDDARVAKFMLTPGDFAGMSLFSTFYDGVQSFNTNKVVAPGTSWTTLVEIDVESEVDYVLSWEIDEKQGMDRATGAPLIVKVGPDADDKFYSDYFPVGTYDMIINNDGLHKVDGGDGDPGTATTPITIVGTLDKLATDKTYDFASTKNAGGLGREHIRDHNEEITWFWPYEVYDKNYLMLFPTTSSINNSVGDGTQDAADTELGNNTNLHVDSIKFAFKIRCTQLDKAAVVTP